MKKLNVKSNRLRQLGQGMTEYIIIVALVAVAGIATYKFFGQTVRNQMAGLSQELSGTTNTGIADAGKSAKSTSDEAKKDKGMSAYGN